MIYKIQHVRKRKHIRSGTKIIPTSITIHSTANPKSKAQNERDKLDREDNLREASFHIVVDEKEAIECIPLDERTIHAGTGNSSSISIEMCESGSRQKVIDNTVTLVAKLLRERNWGVDRLKRHYDWTKKNCPSILSYNNWQGWIEFLALVKIELEGGSKDMTREEIINIVREIITPSLKGEGQNSDHWAYKDLEELNQFLYQNKVEGISSSNLNDRATRGEMIAIVNRIRKGILNLIK
ncbi:N-acetylmuramoyl-L-alanine amidase [Gottschalkia acidurici 9a]|uniref:N-acetylmuramoyl-L-alanine amidase n=1 Tax=Gottschalkia acidurici (strain ATCC 7906 / DSM 604 / BCRC 14475 / CIP 104303 / KCTC 5404 / NCIMB 10678 / 9a) TaxID=1128398 RepID=K0B2N1_GOTA9|nr:N-acetylmuramoyl-L-alanine amidase [Gottschalkia acidurici]AFS79200.1 N-acetylmuramoyl-L-alanine amidase [Gottschalkia acidurici 9a]